MFPRLLHDLKLAGIPGHALRLTTYNASGGHVLEGVLQADDGQWYPITRGVPCFLKGALRPDFFWFQEKYGLPANPAVMKAEIIGDSAHDQLLTNTTFSDKWGRFKRYGIDPEHQVFLYDWYCKKLGVRDEAALRDFYRNKERILEVGPGSGFNSRFMAESTHGQVYALDISEAAYTTYENTHALHNCHVVHADLMDAPFDDNYFDFVLADGVLHHTPDTRKAVTALLKKVKPGGQFFFYVYRKMGPARQFSDRYIREAFTKMDPDACYKACEGLTELGRELSRLNSKVTLETGVPVLGIPPGTHDVQRLLYYNFVKCFWNDAFDFETNNMVNFDWYHPHSAWQHTEEEVAGWLSELGVTDYKFNASNPNGISVLLTKPV